MNIQSYFAWQARNLPSFLHCRHHPPQRRGKVDSAVGCHKSHSPPVHCPVVLGWVATTRLCGLIVMQWYKDEG